MAGMANTPRSTLVVAGNGMVGHRLLEALVEKGATDQWDIVTFAEEPRPAYDRVALSSLFSGSSPDEIALPAPSSAATPGLTVHLGERVASVDRQARQVVSSIGRRVTYDALVLATGSAPFVPPIPGHDAAGCFVYRTIDDVEAIKAWATDCRVGVVIGGGLLGLEAANALVHLGLVTHVVELAPRLMPVQVDDGGGDALRRHIQALGVTVHTGCRSAEVLTWAARGRPGGGTGMGGGPGSRTGSARRVAGLRLDDGKELVSSLVVFSAGIRPRDELARACGLEVGERGGVVVDEACRTSDPAIFAIGECALVAGRTWGLVSPGYQMAKVVADRLMDGSSTFTGADCSTKLKLLGVDVASFGDAHGEAPGTESLTFADARAPIYRKLVLDTADGRVVGGVLVGDASGYTELAAMAQGFMTTPSEPAALVLPVGVAGASTGARGAGVAGLSESATICNCENVSKGSICAAVSDGGATDVAGIKSATKAGTGCGGCLPLLADLVDDELSRAGVAVTKHLCEHFAYSRQELFDIVRAEELTSFSKLLAKRGTGRGCEVCKPAVASMLASTGSGYILDAAQAALQDTNDHFLANLQRDGTYSVIPRVPGGEITPEQLITLGEVARDFGLYSKITGGQRIDLLGARVHQLPAIWSRLVDAGFESGHAYGKALRTVKSCVGTNWCRYGVQDSTALAIQMELRYRGLRSPHKIKSAVSGCSRECAEAQGKDFGVIATEKGWNLYVCGNGGTRPQHAVLLASDLDTETLIRTIDRFLMFYIRTAGRLERTAGWLNKLDGGLDYLRRVVVDDALGIGAELEAAMAHHVETYECEWKATLGDPQRMARFTHFVNSDDVDPGVVMVSERGQPRPAYEGERPDARGVPVLVGATR